MREYGKVSNKRTRVLRIWDVEAMTGYSRSAIYDRLNPKSPRYDKDFPRPFKIGLSAVGWLESAVDDWIVTRLNFTKPGAFQ
ncbi:MULTISPECIES: helix-turn-helix transcriptional regulator [Pseudomonas]|uniref:helix-turn-helix transcriptional regulator n=1 Tax=Pseudomonas TaxID=286 RepID=UPI000CA754A4|nr:MULTISPECIES: AlpA family phage regulatory protein [Pseudomonas]MBF8744981.1 AlpA family phage regulatory protein [Pseudomonas monteilii]PKF25604.1 AlpA family transcriptional regulator [Pseudomonas hunanensis]